MNLEKVQRIFFIGIGGIGMSALARHFHTHGVQVSGYDKTETALTRKLSDEGISITYSDDVKELDRNAELVIYTPAIPGDHLQLNFYRNNDYSVHKRAEVLGFLTNNMKAVAVAGSHGKTSTCSLMNHIFQTAGYDCAAFLGGISLNYNSNYVRGSEWAVVEADEFDRSFHHLRPFAGIITSVDTDHLDVYGNYDAIKEAFRTFASQVSGRLLCHVDVPEEVMAVVSKEAVKSTYGLTDNADYFPGRIEIRDGKYIYDVATPDGLIENLEMSGGGRHNVENSIGALAMARQVGISDDAIRRAISSYRGVERRFEIHLQRPDLVYIDDYAHHPREIEVTLETTRELFPGRRITAIFQPHLYSRTRDLAEGLARTLSMADEVLLLDIYPARELPIEGVTSGVIYRMLKTSKYLVTKNQVITKLIELQPELIITIGAGDIDTLVHPITENFREA